MNKSQFMDQQIVFAIQQPQVGRGRREHPVQEWTFFPIVRIHNILS